MSNAYYHREAGSGAIGLSNKSHLTTSQRRSIMVSGLDQSTDTSATVWHMAASAMLNRSCKSTLLVLVVL